MVLRSFEIVAVEQSIALTNSKVCNERMKTVYNSEPLILDGVYRCLNE